MTDIKQYEPLWGSWYVDEKLGEGSYGKVYKAHKEEFGRTYEAAVKIISIPQSEADIIQAKSEGLNEESARSYFQAFVTDIIQEIDLMSAFRGNTNIVSLEDHKVIEKHDEIGWDILIRMELLNTLSNYVTKKPMTEAEVVKLGIHICQALELCAKHNTIHRDIKPDNIFVSQYGDYKLGDFGIARQIECTMSGLSKKGTYSYMAPEVFKGNEYGASVDTYSLGIVMYRFLNKNRAPFLPEYPNPITPHDRDEALRIRMSGEILPEIKGINPKLSAIVLKACAYDRADRFKEAHEMRLALENLSDVSLYPILERPSASNKEEEKTEYIETKFIKNDDENNEQTQIVFSKRNIPEKNLQTEEKIEEISVPDKVINRLAKFSLIFWGILTVLTFFSHDKSDRFVFLPLYSLCIAQCILKFKNKVMNCFNLTCFIIYLLSSILINFKIFDYYFMIITLSLLPIFASKEEKLKIVHCITMLICTIFFGSLVFHISQETHYTYVTGTIGIPFLTLLSAFIPLLLESPKSWRINTGLTLLTILQFFIPIIFVIYLSGYKAPLLYHVINANFPGFSLERLPWWTYGRFVGILLQFSAFTSLFMIAAAINIPKQFLYAFRNNKRLYSQS